MCGRAFGWPGICLAIILALAAAAQAKDPKPAKAPDWSVAVYIATDEESMGKAFDPRTAHILKVPLPAGVELLVERDSFAENGTLRVIRRGGVPDRTELLPEQDSASAGSVADFLGWAQANARGKKRLLIVVAHSWGWRGIIQDYSLPGRPGEDSMLPLREFAAAMAKAPFKPDVLLFDACVLANTEPLEEFKGLAPFLVASEIELPYNGFPPERLFAALAKGPSPRELARRLPEIYVSAYGHHGVLSGLEKEYYPTALAAIDTAKWNGFARRFKALVDLLARTGFRERIKARPEWIGAFADEDHNVDLVEFLYRLPGLVPDPGVRRAAADLLRGIGYPGDLARRSATTITLDPKKVHSFELVIESDGLMPEADALTDIKKRWLDTHLDLGLPGNLQYELRRIPDQEIDDREFIVRGQVDRPLTLRPWQTGATYVILKAKDLRGRVRVQSWRRDKDWLAAERFPASSFLLSEAHSQGLPFIHGVGLVLYPEMNATMDRSLDPQSGLAGPDFYRTLRWNARTGWSGLMLHSPAR